MQSDDMSHVITSGVRDDTQASGQGEKRTLQLLGRAGAWSDKRNRKRGKNEKKNPFTLIGGLGFGWFDCRCVCVWEATQ